MKLSTASSKIYTPFDADGVAVSVLDATIQSVGLRAAYRGTESVRSAANALIDVVAEPILVDGDRRPPDEVAAVLKVHELQRLIAAPITVDGMPCGLLVVGGKADVNIELSEAVFVQSAAASLGRHVERRNNQKSLEV
ncbi:MAG: hypothetical protein AAFV29_11080, partial [Myxococcota bacterium]